MKILVLNSGSSSIKYQLFDMPSGAVKCSGLVEKIGEPLGAIHQEVEGNTTTREYSLPDHTFGLNKVARLLTDPEFGVIKSPEEIDVVGHRVVHGGESFSATTEITGSVKSEIQNLFSLAPLHNPPNMEGIEVAELVFPHATQVAVFDTAFHQTMPEEAFRFSIPEKLYKEKGIRAYGFHGTSHRFIADAAIDELGLTGKDSNIITIHLGNGCSMAAVKNGKCVDTSMGLGPMGGLIMGTRAGDIDPAVIFFLIENGIPVEEVKDMLNKDSGMKGLAGDNDLRAVQKAAEKGDKSAELAIKMYTYRIKKYIGSYAAALGGVDAIVFSAGVGENSSIVRAKSCEGLAFLGIELDQTKNETRSKGIRAIQNATSKVKIMVIPTNEELAIAKQSYKLVKSQKTA